ncbi:GIY-YIG nuclease family protein [Paenibacillus massiliensis]|uniref:GIY-YIG nuclease family protein n=1 Tax=Paenibacillus massiliensis TaxID=225917 RepID=UPI0003F9BE49|nr:GIY-YIG nuclease family protein [Paenibacillus massiliensis]
MNLTEKVNHLPLTPGVYLMKDQFGTIIYIGKAKALRKRVQSYFHQNTAHSPKVKRLVQQIRDLEVLHTDTEFEAFMLECKLIKQWKPMYNAKMKNPLAYTYLALRTNGVLKHIEIIDTPEDIQVERIWGPYTSKSMIEQALYGLQEALQLLCSHPHLRRGSMPSGSSPCLNYELGLCLGVCTGELEAIQQYNERVERISLLLQEEDQSILEDMEQRMYKAGEAYEFEVAARIRDQLKAVRFLLRHEQVVEFAAVNHQIAVLERMEDGRAKLMLVTGSRIIDSTLLDILELTATEQRRTLRSAIIHGLQGMQDDEDSGNTTLAEPQHNMSRDDIDEAQIVYRYIQSEECCYVNIRPHMLNHGDQEGEHALDEAITHLLSGIGSFGS